MFVRYSLVRLEKIKVFVRVMGIEYKNGLCFDVPTRMN